MDLGEPGDEVGDVLDDVGVDDVVDGAAGSEAFGEGAFAPDEIDVDEVVVGDLGGGVFAAEGLGVGVVDVEDLAGGFSFGDDGVGEGADLEAGHGRGGDRCFAATEQFFAPGQGRVERRQGPAFGAAVGVPVVAAGAEAVGADGEADVWVGVEVGGFVEAGGERIVVHRASLVEAQAGANGFGGEAGLAQRGGLAALGEALAGGVSEQGVVGVGGFGPVHQGLQEAVEAGGGAEVIAAGDEGDGLEGVVVGDAEVVGGWGVLAGEHRVAEGFRAAGEAAFALFVPGEGAGLVEGMVELEAEGVVFALGDTVLGLGRV